MKRISIVGTSGSGKTTMAKALSKSLNLPHHELDSLHWLPDWKERQHDDFRKLVEEKIGGEAWVIEGNYSKVRDLVWNRSTTIIWLNLPFRVVFTRMIKRIFKRSLTKEVLWSGNQETIFKHFLTKDSMLLWVVKTYSKRKKEYPILFKDQRFEHIEKIELKSQREIDRFLEIANLELTQN